MVAVFEDGGKQYRVRKGDTLLVERRDLDEKASKVTFDRVLLVGEGDQARIGTPVVEGASVSAKIIAQVKTPKVVGIKLKRRKGYMRKFGHRQKMLKVQIEKIKA
jgi:large subunit ribosomal protein L21